MRRIKFSMPLSSMIFVKALVYSRATGMIAAGGINANEAFNRFARPHIDHAMPGYYPFSMT